MSPPSILFCHARVIDGSGGPSYLGSVLVRDGRIAAVVRAPASGSSDDRLRQLRGDAVRVVDCERGRFALVPGFIDMHAHSDLSVLHTPRHEAKVTQGVTTEVVGQDGISYAPVTDTSLGWVRAQIAGWNGNPPEAAFWAWRSVGEYLATLDARRIATNVVYLVPQGNLRMLVLGYDPRPATPDELHLMQHHLRRALREGAVGMSSGLTYVPGMYAPNSELASLLAVVAEFGGYYSPHHRSYGRGAMAAYAEMIALAKATGVRLHLTHATLNFAENKGRAAEFLEMLAAARRDGVSITLDTYPYLPGSTTLAALLPSWAAAGGNVLARLQDPEQVPEIQRGVEVVGTDGCHGCTLEWDTIEISGVANPELSGVVGKTIAEITATVADGSEGVFGASAVSRSGGAGTTGWPNPPPTGAPTAFDVFRRLLIQDQMGTTILQHVGHEENVRAIMQDPFHCGGSDGILVGAKPHPRAWGTFPRFLGHYTRDLPLGKSRDIYVPPEAGAMAPVPPPYGDDGAELVPPLHEEIVARVEPMIVFSGGLEEAVAHLTSRAAAVVGITDRGLIKTGMRADLVLLDPQEVQDAATFAHPRRCARGIRFVLINGGVVVDESEPTGQRFGHTVRLVPQDSGWVVK